MDRWPGQAQTDGLSAVTDEERCTLCRFLTVEESYCVSMLPELLCADLKLQKVWWWCNCLMIISSLLHKEGRVPAGALGVMGPESPDWRCMRCLWDDFSWLFPSLWHSVCLSLLAAPLNAAPLQHVGRTHKPFFWNFYYSFLNKEQAHYSLYYCVVISFEIPC